MSGRLRACDVRQLLWTPDGWTHAGDAVGTVVAWSHARKLCRERLSIQPGYQFGYLVGATCSDGTVGKYRFALTPHPGFLVNGHLARVPWDT
ncbi:hypothetical protein ACTVZO_19770 [Streptomyces sp. IBSNAI002]|uniref:hypothetical protein n=1 Tax=Streptomyces sp. IBSNAI002 TaxID=3457500 RepID=UPI003FCFEA17